MKKKDTMQKIIQAIFNGWTKENLRLLDDINDLANEIVIFNIKWGTKLEAKDLIPTPKKGKI